MRSLGPRFFVGYIRYFVISVVNKQYKRKEINSLGPEKLVCLLYQISSYTVSTVLHSLAIFKKVYNTCMSGDLEWNFQFFPPS